MRELRALTDARVRESVVETGVTSTNYRRSDQQRLRDQETRAEGTELDHCHAVHDGAHRVLPNSEVEISTGV